MSFRNRRRKKLAKGRDEGIESGREGEIYNLQFCIPKCSDCMHGMCRVDVEGDAYKIKR